MKVYQAAGVGAAISLLAVIAGLIVISFASLGAMTQLESDVTKLQVELKQNREADEHRSEMMARWCDDQTKDRKIEALEMRLLIEKRK